MDAHHPDDPRFDAAAQGRADRRRLLRAFNLSLGFILVMVLAYAAQGSFDWRPWGHRAEHRPRPNWHSNLAPIDYRVPSPPFGF